MTAILHSSFELLALIRIHILQSFFHRLPAVLLFVEELFPLFWRHIVPAFFQLPFFIRWKIVEPFSRAAQLLAFFRRQFTEVIEFLSDPLALFRCHPFPGLHPLLHILSLLR